MRYYCHIASPNAEICLPLSLSLFSLRSAPGLLLQVSFRFPGIRCPDHCHSAADSIHLCLHQEEVEGEDGQYSQGSPLHLPVLSLVPGEDSEIHQPTGIHRGI